MTPKKLHLAALENASLLRKFTILFILMSILPIGVLEYFYFQLIDAGEIRITPENYRITLTLVVFGVIVGYWVMRLALKKIIQITEQNTRALETVLGSTRVKELSQTENEVEVLSQAFNEITSRLEDNVRKLEKAKKTLHSVLSKVGRGISSMQNIDSFLELIVETVSDALDTHVGTLFLIKEDSRELYVKTVYGSDYARHRHLRISLDEEPFATISRISRPLHISRMEGDGIAQNDRVLFSAPLLCAPLILHDKCLGMICVSGKNSGEDFKDDEKNLLANLALQTAVAIENARLSEDAEKTYLETITALALAVEAKDPYSRGHLERVAKYAVKTARYMGLSDEEMAMLRDAARLHDIGKIGILDEVLRKPGRLTPEEWDMMEKHVVIGESIIKPIRSMRGICDIIRHHHEMLDGSGYPDKLKGDQISLLTRILTVADIFDAITSDRPYRKAFTAEQAKEELVKMDGKLDQTIVQNFFESLEN